MVAGMPFTYMLLFTLLWLVVQTNVMSNMLSMTLVYTIVLPVAASAGMGNSAALGATIAAAANYAFALPSATTSTALVVGSGWVPVDQMARYGAMMVVPTLLIFAFFCYPIAAMILL
jgi:sodium-dependent dicarboxylate transporter 2/3/5